MERETSAQTGGEGANIMACDLARRADGLRRLAHAKHVLAGDLERLLAEEERTIAWLRVGVEDAHGEYETLRQRFCERFSGPPDDGELPAVLSRALPDVRSSCDRVANEVTATDMADGDDPNARRCVAVVDALRSDARSLAELACCPLTGADRKDATTGIISADDVVELARLLDEAEVVPRLSQTAVASGVRPELAALWRAIRSMYGDNRRLNEAARALERDTCNLQEDLGRATSEHMALSSDKADKTTESVALDEFCAVTGEMTALQIRNLEFGRLLAVDGKLIAEDLDRIEELKAKISRKQKKRQKLLAETDDAKSQLEAFGRKCAELERKRACVTDDLANMKRSPCEMGADQSDPRAFGERAKQLKQLKIQYNQLANTRDTLKLKLQRHQQSLMAKTPSRLNHINTS